MGQKVSPHGLRVGVIKDWNSKWYADKKILQTTLLRTKKSEITSRKDLRRRRFKDFNRKGCQ